MIIMTIATVMRRFATTIVTRHGMLDLLARLAFPLLVRIAMFKLPRIGLEKKIDLLHLHDGEIIVLAKTKSPIPIKKHHSGISI